MHLPSFGVLVPTELSKVKEDLTKIAVFRIRSFYSNILRSVRYTVIVD